MGRDADTLDLFGVSDVPVVRGAGTVPVRDTDGSIIGTAAMDENGRMTATIGAGFNASMAQGFAQALRTQQADEDRVHVGFDIGDEGGDFISKARANPEIRILHLADLHIDEHATMAKQVRRDSQGRNLVIGDTLRACIEAADKAGRLDGIVIAGDVYHRPKPSPNEEAAAAHLLDQLAGRCAATTCCVLPGNHDMTNGTQDREATASMGWHMGAVVVDTPQVIDYAGLRVACLPYPRRGAVREMGPLPDGVSEREALSAVLKTVALSLRAQGADCLVAHATVTGAVVGVQPRPLDGDIELDKDTLAAFKATMLGHLHQPQEIRLTKGTARYAGTPVIGSFGESDGVPRGALLWRFDRATKDLIAVESIEVEQRQWITYQVGEIVDRIGSWVDVDDVEACIRTTGTIYRIRGELSHEAAGSVRAVIRSKRAQGFWVQDEIKVLAEDRTRDADVAKAESDEEIIGRALVTRGVKGEESARALALHRDIVQGG